MSRKRSILDDRKRRLVEKEEQVDALQEPTIEAACEKQRAAYDASLTMAQRLNLVAKPAPPLDASSPALLP